MSTYFLIQCRFPKNTHERKRWIRSILILTGQQIDALVSGRSRICGNHFAGEDYKISGNKQILRKNAVPTIFAKTTKEETFVFLQEVAKKKNHSLLS